ncbi:hypothetical protein TUBRATIS_29880 [Tubulinosema ratisbonensis]|uniref:Uncharacterized protein n=1 Tax=Tubulinosema ratisbonensis TaxID=291195 RepID=A0A437AHE6_9MICR|nr:hypothetical protein TUBRATIS_29880 [Tubulinosema ratisbonensis]
MSFLALTLYSIHIICSTNDMLYGSNTNLLKNDRRSFLRSFSLNDAKEQKIKKRESFSISSALGKLKRFSFRKRSKSENVKEKKDEDFNTTCANKQEQNKQRIWHVEETASTSQFSVDFLNEKYFKPNTQNVNKNYDPMSLFQENVAKTESSENSNKRNSSFQNYTTKNSTFTNNRCVHFNSPSTNYESEETYVDMTQGRNSYAKPIMLQTCEQSFIPKHFGESPGYANMPSLKSLVSFAHRKEENLDEMNTTYDGYMIMKSPLVSSFGHYSKNKASIGTQTDTTANHCQKCNEVQTCSRCRRG